MSQTDRTVQLVNAYNRAFSVREHAPNICIVLSLLILREIAAISNIGFPGSSHYVILALVFCVHQVYTLDRTDHELFTAVDHVISERVHMK